MEKTIEDYSREFYSYICKNRIKTVSKQCVMDKFNEVSHIIGVRIPKVVQYDDAGEILNVLIDKGLLFQDKEKSWLFHKIEF